MRTLLFTAAVLSAACAPDELAHPLDFEEIAGDDGKADGPFASFSASRVVSDDAFFDSGALDPDQVQRFLEETPYGTRSFLADEPLADGRTVAEALVAAAEEHQLNPLVLLVTIQKEAGLISRTQRPRAHLVDFALGCGCPDGGGCREAFRGLDRQLSCAAGRLRSYADDIAEAGATISGWAPGQASRTLDGVSVVPANVATALLYTYTPWVLEGRGGNWLFWNIWRRHAVALDYDRGLRFPFNEGYIGGACATEVDCFYPGAMCLDTGDGAGLCTLPCATTCPDRAGPGWATTFCVTLAGEGRCVAQCTSRGCDVDQTCERRPRHSDPAVTRDVCLPAP